MPPVDEIYLIHHSHTDIGYTHDQPVLWDLQRRFFETALDFAVRDADRDGADAFRWTVETTAPLLRWLEAAPEARVDEFLALEAAGRIEVTAMLANVTPLYGPAQTVEMLRPVRYLREEYGVQVSHAMNCDINGQNWPLADTLLDADVDALSMSINDHFGGSPFRRPHVFEWEAPSGRSLLAYDGFIYSMGWNLGIGRDAEEFREEWWPRLAERLEAVEWPLPAIMVQSFHPFGDNGPAYDFTSWIRDWNDQQAVRDGDLPRVRMATPRDWWGIVENHRDALPTHRGDWTDFWNFGAGSSARELAMNRESRRRLHTADALEGALGALGAPRSERPPTRRPASGTRSEAWWALHFFDEHTWGSHTSISDPAVEDTISQWYHKAKYAYDARSLSQLCQRDAVAELARRVARDEQDAADAEGSR